jgi:hypothetical protein
MNRRSLVAVLAWIVCGASVVAVLVRSSELRTLRAEPSRRLEPAVTAASDTGNPAAEDSRPQPSSPANSLEVLKLRDEIGQLTARKAVLAKSAAEAQRLRAEVAQASGDTGYKLPASFIRRAQANDVGMSSPENTLQTFLWALQHRDFTRLLATMTPTAAERMRSQFQQGGRTPEDLFKEAEILPGLGIRGREDLPDGAVQLETETIPGQPTSKLRLELVDGAWKLATPF